jgi:metal-dependent HD superfamily phosphatase/phosphodiesterase
MSNFQLNFNSPKKVVSITLDEEEGIFQLAYLFKKLLDDAGIKNKVEEKEVQPVEALQVANEKLD